MDGNVRNCKFENWTRPAVHIVKRSLILDDNGFVPEPDISPEREAEIMKELGLSQDDPPLPPTAEVVKKTPSPIDISNVIKENPDSGSSNPSTQDKETRHNQFHAKASVEDILKLARGERPRTEWEHYLQTTFPDNFDLPCC
jgi:hypothetical protein